MIKVLVIKQFTSGILKGESFTDQIEARCIRDLEWLDLVGKEVETFSGSNYRVGGVSLYDTELCDYVTRGQAVWKVGK
jgi:hypothetical protein